MLRNKLPLKALKAFEVTARYSNISKAANELNVTQSAVSKQILHLESLLNERLFKRQAHGLILTPAGQHLLLPIQQAFELIDTAAWHLEANKSVQHIRINAPATFARRWLGPRLSLLQEHFPETQIHLNTLPDHIDNNDLKDSDLSIRLGLQPWSGLLCERLFHETHIAVCAPQLLNIKHRNMLDIHKSTLIHTINCNMSWEKWFDADESLNKHTKPNVQKGLFFDVHDLAIKAAIDARGIALIDQHMIEHEILEGSLVQWQTKKCVTDASYWLVCKPMALKSEGVNLVHSWILNQIRDSRNKSIALSI